MTNHEKFPYVGHREGDNFLMVYMQTKGGGLVRDDQVVKVPLDLVDDFVAGVLAVKKNALEEREAIENGTFVSQNTLLNQLRDGMEK